MDNLKILGPRDTGKGILIEYDAGYINPRESRNLEILKENKNFLKKLAILAARAIFECQCCCLLHPKQLF